MSDPYAFVDMIVGRAADKPVSQTRAVASAQPTLNVGGPLRASCITATTNGAVKKRPLMKSPPTHTTYAMYKKMPSGAVQPPSPTNGDTIAPRISSIVTGALPTASSTYRNP